MITVDDVELQWSHVRINVETCRRRQGRTDMRTKLKVFTCVYFRYYAMPNGDLADGGIREKKIKAADFEDAWERWWHQNPGGDVCRQIILIEDENGVQDSRD